MQKLQTVKGTKDLFGQVAVDHEHIYDVFIQICEFLNFQKIFTPIIEYSDVFKKTLGTASDIITKEMYNFTDQGGDDLVLRPEGTAAVARAIISNSLQDQINKNYYYFGPMFRRERPQSGRLRQFHQVGVEIFGEKNFYDDVRSIILAEKFLSKLKVRDKLKLQINTLGNKESRLKYIKILKNFFKENISYLSPESKKKIEINPLRILDSKNEEDQEIIIKSPLINDFLDKESNNFFKNFCDALDSLDLKFEINQKLVRGLDYYNHTAFEYVTNSEKSQNAVLAGGRYDGLVKSLGGGDLTGVGWAAGVERIKLILDNNHKQRKLISIFSTSEFMESELIKIYNKLNVNKEISILMINGASVKKKITKADKLKSFGCIIAGDEEWKTKKLIWKNFKDGKQEFFSFDNLEDFIKKKIEA